MLARPVGPVGEGRELVARESMPVRDRMLSRPGKLRMTHPAADGPRKHGTQCQKRNRGVRTGAAEKAVPRQNGFRSRTLLRGTAYASLYPGRPATAPPPFAPP